MPNRCRVCDRYITKNQVLCPSCWKVVPQDLIVTIKSQQTAPNLQAKSCIEAIRYAEHFWRGRIES